MKIKTLEKIVRDYENVEYKGNYLLIDNTYTISVYPSNDNESIYSMSYMVTTGCRYEQIKTFKQLIYVIENVEMCIGTEEVYGGIW